MIENFAILSGVAALVVSFMAIIAFLLLKKNIKDILEKDTLVFDKNFEIKYKAITASFEFVDEVMINGKSANLDEKYIERAIKCHNDLLCVISNKNVIDEFYNITLNVNYPVNFAVVMDYKMACRADIGLKNKIVGIKKSKEATVAAQPQTQPVQAYTQQPAVQPEPYIPSQPITPQQPVQPQPMPQQNTQQRPVQPRPAQPQQRPMQPGVKPTQPRPVQPQQRPVARPTNPEEKK